MKKLNISEKKTSVNLIFSIFLGIMLFSLFIFLLLSNFNDNFSNQTKQQEELLNQFKKDENVERIFYPIENRKVLTFQTKEIQISEDIDFEFNTFYKNGFDSGVKCDRDSFYDCFVLEIFSVKHNKTYYLSAPAYVSVGLPRNEAFSQISIDLPELNNFNQIIGLVVKQYTIDENDSLIEIENTEKQIFFELFSCNQSICISSGQMNIFDYDQNQKDFSLFVEFLKYIQIN